MVPGLSPSSTATVRPAGTAAHGRMSRPRGTYARVRSGPPRWMGHRVSPVDGAGVQAGEQQYGTDDEYAEDGRFGRVEPGARNIRGGLEGQRRQVRQLMACANPNPTAPRR